MSIIARISSKIIDSAKVQAKVENRSINGQIEYWAQIDKIAKENSELSCRLINELAIGTEELDSSLGTEYNFG
jgi:hypothetical protein